MNGNPILMALQMAQGGRNPMGMLQQMMGGNPQMARAMQMLQGKSPAQLRQMAENMAKERGMSLDMLAQQMGLRLPGR